jgi:3-hydroxyacyl-CoA dehydrogenase
MDILEAAKTKVCVIGGGAMGRQIALNTAIHGYPVVLTDMSESVCAMFPNGATFILKTRIQNGN